MASDEWADRIATVAADNRSGASSLVPNAVSLLRDASASGPDIAGRVASALCQAQPSMASIWIAAALALDPNGPDRLNRFAARCARAPAALSRVAVALFSPEQGHGRLTVATVSASGSVRHCLLAAARQYPLDVICAEGRPIYEGRQLAKGLAAGGVSTTLCTDAAVGSFIEDVDLVLVGADAVTPEWFINKCGTRQIASVAAAAGRPVYVVASRDKFLGEPLSLRLDLGYGAAREVWADPPAGVQVANPYFERIPLECVAMVITDAGAIGVGSVRDVCRASLDGASAVRLEKLLVRVQESSGATENI